MNDTPSTNSFRDWFYANFDSGKLRRQGGKERAAVMCESLTRKDCEMLRSMLANSTGLGKTGQPRRGDFMFDKEHGGVPSAERRERAVEWNVWKRYWPDADVRSFGSPLAFLHSYQVPLQPRKYELSPVHDDHAKPELGEIDLVGSTIDGLPVPIELKIADTGKGRRDWRGIQGILAPLMEITAYALTLRYYWPNGLSEEWRKMEDRHPVPPTLVGRETPIILMADEAYWNDSRAWLDGFWENLRSITQTLADCCLPVYAARLNLSDLSFRVVPWKYLEAPNSKQSGGCIVWPP